MLHFNNRPKISKKKVIVGLFDTCKKISLTKSDISIYLVKVSPLKATIIGFEPFLNDFFGLSEFHQKVELWLAVLSEWPCGTGKVNTCLPTVKEKKDYINSHSCKN